MREAIANEQIFLQLLFKKNEKILQVLAENEMLKNINEGLKLQRDEAIVNA